MKIKAFSETNYIKCTYAHSIRQELSYVKPSSPQTGLRILGHIQGGLLARATAMTTEHTMKVFILLDLKRKNDFNCLIFCVLLSYCRGKRI